FKNIVNDFARVVWKHAEDNHNTYRTEKFYRNYYPNMYSNPDLYSVEREEEMFAKYKFHLSLIDDLVLELTRAANYVCDFVREYLFEGFRLEEGVLLVNTGDILGSQSYRVEYRDGERILHPYPGLREFMTIRESRDLN